MELARLNNRGLVKPYICKLMLLNFRNKLKAAAATCCINSTFGETTSSECMAQNWTGRLHTEDHVLDDRLRSNRFFGHHDRH